MGDISHGVREGGVASMASRLPWSAGIEETASRRRGAASMFVDEFYATAVDQARLGTALALLARTFNAVDALFIDHDGRLSAADKGANASSRTPALTADMARQIVSAQTAEVCVGKIESVAARNYLTISPDAPGGSFATLLVVREQAFSDGDFETALAMVSDVRRALRLRGSARGADVLGLRMFENTPVAMLITRRRVIERANAAATALLEDNRPLSVVGGKLRFEDSRAQAGFEAISKSDAGRNGQALAFIVEGAGGRTWIAQLSPLKQAGVQDGSWVVVALSPFTGASQTRETLLNGFTELTPTERAIFASFVDGEDIAAIAAKMSRSVETVRWHVRNLFTKLGVNSQADLARLGALLLPI